MGQLSIFEYKSKISQPFVLARGAHFAFVYFGSPHDCGRTRRCLIKLPTHENFCPQDWQTYGFIPVCNDECVTKLSRCANPFLQTCLGWKEKPIRKPSARHAFYFHANKISLTKHLYGFSLVWDRSWIFNCPRLKKLLPQKLQRCFFSPRWISMCAFNVFGVINFASH